MKITKDGKLKLARNDIQLGNFVATLGETAVRLSDISQMVRITISRRTTNGQYLELCFNEEQYRTGLEHEARLAFYLFAVAKDAECMSDILKALDACVARHPDVYGKQDGTDEEHEEATREVREMTEFGEEVKNLPDDEGR